ncbi:MAG: PKD domain-containing protein, partial [Planctomycetes bacterium]|nr:PKD domain-containing protein [Planctomycetota bacterium]
PLEDAIEIVNLSPTTVTIGGWYLSDNRTSLSTLAKFRIPFGMSLPPGGFEVFYEYEFNDPASPARFSLSDQGGAVYLSAANASGELTGYIVQAEYGPEDPGVSFGRIATSQKYDFTALSGRSFGADSPSTVEEFRTGLGRINEAPRFGPVVINEIMYHPVFGEEEFVELFNPTTVPIALFDETSGRGWRISGVLNPDESDSYEFGPSDVIPAQGFLLLVGINPVVFRSLNSIPGSVPIASAFGGALDNGGEWIRLSRPGTPAGSEVPYILVDQVRYNDREPWATEPDGSGPSLERIYADAYGNDPVNWGPSDRFGGTPGAMNSVSTAGENRPPQALFLAYPTTGRAPLDVIFDATRSYDLDGQIVSYSWNFDDGGSSSGAIVAHTFDEPDVYLVTLTVEDDDGAISNVTQFIAVETDPGGGQIPGDANQDATVDISDAIRLLQYLFLPGQRLPCSGDDLQSGGNQVLLNLNQDARVDLSDAIFTLMFLFQNGPPPALGTGCVPIAGCPDVCAY